MCHTRFVLRDPEMGQLRVTGTFRTGDVGALRRALRKQFSIFSRKDTRGRVVLVPLPT
jgi:ferric-dicitrate binding protein FerR (iron transport regulator)